MRSLGLVSSIALVAVLIGGALLPSPAAAARAAPPRGVVAFTRPRPGNEFLFVLRAATGRTHQIASPVGAHDCCVSLFSVGPVTGGTGELGSGAVPGRYSRPFQPQWGTGMPSGTAASFGE